MTYDERLQNISVLGAAGKMGSGILLLTAVEMADRALLTGKQGKTFSVECHRCIRRRTGRTNELPACSGT